MRLKIDRASLIVGSKFTVFALFYFAFEGNFPSARGGGGAGGGREGSFYLEGRFNGGSFALPALGGLYLEGLIHGRVYFRNFTVNIWDLIDSNVNLLNGLGSVHEKLDAGELGPTSFGGLDSSHSL